jgi:hypothetical protein
MEDGRGLCTEGAWLDAEKMTSPPQQPLLIDGKVNIQLFRRIMAVYSLFYSLYQMLVYSL